MEYKVLYRKYRPKDFDNLVGQDYILRTLKTAINKSKCGHAYIFSGPRGTGKTSTAKIFAKAINCTNNKDGNPCDECFSCNNFENNPDIIEIDAASNNGVDDIRELINNVKLVPTASKYKIYIIDEVHMLSQSAFNALLLTLEEPPSHVIFILATTDIQNVPITVLSRCQRFDFKYISVDNIKGKLKQVAMNEKITISENALEEIAYLSEGALRDALSILDQLVGKDNGEISAAEVINSFGTVSIENIRRLIDDLEKNRVNEIINEMDNLADSGVNYKIFVEKLIKELKNEAIKRKTVPGNYNLDFSKLRNLILDLNNNITNSKMSVNPYLLIQLIILDYIDEKGLSSGRKEDVDTKIDKKQLILEEKAIDTNKMPEKKVSTKKNKFLSEVRVNNCFVNAKKEFLKIIKEDWEEFKVFLKKNDKEMLSTIIESEIVTASDEYAVLMLAAESEVNLINEKLDELASNFHKFVKKDYKFVAITAEEWQNEREKYISSIKNNIKYNIIEEKEEILGAQKTESKIQVVAKEIFGDKIEVK